MAEKWLPIHLMYMLLVLAAITFCNYHCCYVSERKRPSAASSHYIGLDGFGRHVARLKEPRLVRFSDHGPAWNPEGFFFNELLQKVPFTVETSLLSAVNTTGTYFNECC